MYVWFLRRDKACIFRWEEISGRIRRSRGRGICNQNSLYIKKSIINKRNGRKYS